MRVQAHQRVPHGKKLLTFSALREFRACQRLYRLQVVEGIRQAEDPHELLFGTLGHTALEAWFKAPKAQRLSAAISALATVRDPMDRLQLTEMLRGYHFRWGEEPYEVLAVERQFCCDLVHPDSGEVHPYWVLGGKIDAIVRDQRTGETLTVEHKTSGSNISKASDYWRRLRMDSQVSVYHQAAQAMGFDPVGCLYDVLGKPGLKLQRATPEADRKYRKDGALYANQRERDETIDEYRERLIEDIAANPEGYYARGQIPRLEAEMTEAMRDLWNLADQIAVLEETTIAPRNPDSCFRFGRPCQFLEVCEGGASLEDQQFVRSGRHPELTGAA